MRAKIVLLPGDGPGVELMEQAERVLTSLAVAFEHNFVMVEERIGGASIDAYGAPMTEEALDACREADGVLLGLVGGEKWAHLTGDMRPQSGVEVLEDGLNLTVIMRRCHVFPEFSSLSLLREAQAKRLDVLIAQPTVNSVAAVTRAARLSFRRAREHAMRRLCTIAPPGEAGKLWEAVLREAAGAFPGVSLARMTGEEAMETLVCTPEALGVVLVPAGESALCRLAVRLTGAPSLLCDERLGPGRTAVYSPVPPACGQGADTVNPLGMLLAVERMLRGALRLSREADCLRMAITNVLAAGWRTADLAAGQGETIGTRALGRLVTEQIDLAGAFIRSPGENFTTPFS